MSVRPDQTRPRPAFKALRRLRLWISPPLILVIFLLDTFTPLISAVAVFYVVPLLMLGEFLSVRKIQFLFAAMIGLATFSLLYDHGPKPEFATLLRFCVSIAAISITGLLVVRTLRDRQTLLSQAAALRVSEARYRNIFNTLAVGIWEHDFAPLRMALRRLRETGVEDLRGYLMQRPEFVRETQQMIPITDANDTALKLLGVERKEDFFQTLAEILPPTGGSFIDFLVAFDEGHSYYQAETEVLDRHGRTIPIIVAITFPPPGGETDRVQAVILNIAERRRLQLAFDLAKQDADQALRAAAMGELSASIAHEVNQPLAAIMTSSEAALRWMDRSPPNLDETREALADVLHATRHATGVVKRVRKLVSRNRPETERVAVDVLTTEALSLVHHDLGRMGIAVSAQLAAADAVIQADRVLLQQVVVNLVMNAAQAMTAADTPVPTIVVRTRLHDGQAVIDIIDNGPGFDADSAQRAFDAFYTTKTEGMGLGLAICRSTVEAHDGTIAIISELGAGARLSISLPVLTD